MGGLGGFNPGPRRFGGAASTDLEAVHLAIASANGTAIATDRGTISWLENHATARVVHGIYRTAERLGSVNDPARMTDTLPRWEKILRLSPGSQSLPERRARVAAALSLLSAGTAFQVLDDYLRDLLGEMYLGLEFPDPLTATTRVPGGGSVPGGGPTFVDGNDADPNISPYSSSLAHVAILLQKPIEMSDPVFYERAGSIRNVIDNLIGAWMTYSVVRDGPNGKGFFLDESFNLDNQRFRI